MAPLADYDKVKQRPIHQVDQDWVEEYQVTQQMMGNAIANNPTACQKHLATICDIGTISEEA